MLLPAMLRKKTKKDIKIGWFLHTPFPSSEIYRYVRVKRSVGCVIRIRRLIRGHFSF